MSQKIYFNENYEPEVVEFDMEAINRHLKHSEKAMKAAKKHKYSKKAMKQLKRIEQEQQEIRFLLQQQAAINHRSNLPIPVAPKTAWWQNGLARSLPQLLELVVMVAKKFQRKN